MIRNKRFYIRNFWWRLKFLSRWVFSQEFLWVVGLRPRKSCDGSKTYSTCEVGTCRYHGWIEQGFKGPNKAVDWLVSRRLLRDLRKKNMG